MPEDLSNKKNYFYKVVARDSLLVIAKKHLPASKKNNAEEVKKFAQIIWNHSKNRTDRSALKNAPHKVQGYKYTRSISENSLSDLPYHKDMHTRSVLSDERRRKNGKPQWIEFTRQYWPGRGTSYKTYNPSTDTRIEWIILYVNELVWIPDQSDTYVVVNSVDAFSSFRFIVRGQDSLFYKWITKTNRTTPDYLVKQNNDVTGVKVKAILEYFFNTCNIKKIFPGTLDTYAKFEKAFELIEENKKYKQTKSNKVLFGEEVRIPIKHKMIKKQKTTAENIKFTELNTLHYSKEKSLTDANLTNVELQTMSNVLFHAFYDERVERSMADKAFDNVGHGPFGGLFFFYRNRRELAFIMPARFKDSVQTKVEKLSDGTVKRKIITTKLSKNNHEPEYKTIVKLLLSYDLPTHTEKRLPLPKNTKVNIFTYASGSSTRTAYPLNPVIIDNDTGKLLFTTQNAVAYEFEIDGSNKNIIDINDKKMISKRDLNSKLSSDKKYLFTNPVFMVPDKTSLKTAKWQELKPGNPNPVNYTSDRVLFFNPLTGQPLDDNKTKKIHLILTPEWQHIQFKYYNYKEKTINEIPQCILLEGYKENTQVAGTSIWQNGILFMPWIPKDHHHVVRDENKHKLKFETKDHFIKSKVSGNEAVIETKTTIRSKSVESQRMEYFDLPEKWESQNWIVEQGNSSGMGGTITKDTFQKFIKKSTDDSHPIMISLDAVALTDSAKKALSWTAPSSSSTPRDRFTLFNICMDIVQPDSNRPFWHTSNKPDSNFFDQSLFHDSSNPLPPRVVALHGKFYNIVDERSESGHVIGAKAAVLNDTQYHVHEKCKPAAYTNIGNFELHYFKGCLKNYGTSTVNYKEIGALINYWSCFVFPNATGKAPDGTTALAAATSTTTGGTFYFPGLTNTRAIMGTIAQANNFIHPGIKNVFDRFDSKKIMFTNKSTGIVAVRPIFFFEGLDRDPHRISKMNVMVAGRIEERRTTGGTTSWVSDGESNRNFVLGTKYACFTPNSYQRTPGAPSFYAWFTMAHEVGHGGLGLKDEYIETDSNTRLPEFDQYYKGMPFSVDNRGLMRENEFPRSRNLWYFCYWVNKKAAHLTNRARFEVNFKVPSGTATHATEYETFVRGNDYKLSIVDHLSKDKEDIYKYDKGKENPVINSTRRYMGLYLYQLGKDETGDIIPIRSSGSTMWTRRANRSSYISNSTANKHFDSVLVVKSNLLIKFTGTWTTADKRSVLSEIDNGIREKLGYCFYLTRNGATVARYNSILIYFSSFYQLEGSSSDKNLEIIFAKNGNGTPTISSSSSSSAQIQIGEYGPGTGTTPSALMNRLINNYTRLVRAIYGLTINTTGTIAKSELNFLKTWVESQIGGTYQIKP